MASLVGVRPRGYTIRNRAYAGQTIALEITNINQVERVPENLQRAFTVMIRRLEKALVANYIAHTPGSKRPSGRLGRHVQARRYARGKIVVGVFGTAFAASLNRGFTSKPKNRKALRFTVKGDEVFSRRARVPGKRFHEKAIATTPPIVEAIYDMAFYDINELRFG